MDKIVITRPKEQATSIAKKLENYNYVPIIFPMIEIKETEKDLSSVLNTIKENDTLIFISKNSVTGLIENLSKYNLHLPKVKIYAVGKSSAQLAENILKQPVVYPEDDYSSHSLTKLLPNLENKNVFIMRGNGGDNTIIEHCLEQKANLKIVEVYVREKPEYTESKIRDVITSNNIIVITSKEALFNLISLASEYLHILREYTMIVISLKLYNLANFLEFKKVVLAKSAVDEDIINAIHRTTNKHQHGNF